MKTKMQFAEIKFLFPKRKIFIEYCKKNYANGKVK